MNIIKATIAPNPIVNKNMRISISAIAPPVEAIPAHDVSKNIKLINVKIIFFICVLFKR